jgi:hypothetical protein
VHAHSEKMVMTHGSFLILGLMVTGHQGRIQKYLRLSEHTDMTIHWKALEEYFLMVPLVFRFTHFRAGNMHFLNFSNKTRYFF